MQKFILFLVSFAVLATGCEEGLQPVNGFHGQVTFPEEPDGSVTWPDSLKGAVVAFADARSIDIENLSMESLVRNLLGFSQPLNERQTQEYFIEALPGSYIAGVVGTTVPVDQLILQPMDSLLAHPEYFQLLGIYGYAPTAAIPIGLIIVPDDETIENIHIDTQYNFQSQLDDLF
jgi:hypothetical protein